MSKDLGGRTLKELKQFGDRVRARALRVKCDAVAAAVAFPTERITIIRRAPATTQSFQELKERGDHATARGRDLMLQFASAATRSQDFRDWLYTIHQHRP